MSGLNISVKKPAKAAVKMNPFSDVDAKDPVAKSKRDRARSMRPLHMRRDCPEGFVVDAEVWGRMNELRTQKIESEHAVKKQSALVADITGYSSALKSLCTQIESRINAIEKSISSLELKISRDAVNYQILAQLKQGHDEVKQAAVVTDYGDAVLVDRRVVEGVNRELRRLGNEKIGTMTKIKEFRKNINFLEWELDYFTIRASGLEAHYTDLHMLRVTKDLQEFLKEGKAVNRNKLLSDKAVRKLHSVAKTMESKLAKLRKTRRSLARDISRKEEENRTLAGQRDELVHSVTVRESILNNRGSGGTRSKGSAGDDRMKSIVTRRKLMDLARAQTDEIEFLRQELDRLRQRTFPSFAHASRAHYEGNVDEIL